mgnify:FL=1
MAYYSEKYRHEKYELNEELVKPYLQLDSVKRGVFLLANKLYGLNFTPNPEVPVYHPEVTAYDVTDKDGRFLAELYLDFFPRLPNAAGLGKPSSGAFQSSRNTKPARWCRW